MKKELYKRAFLNLEQHGHDSGGGMSAIRIRDGELSISDCYKTINLDFDIYEPGDSDRELDNYEYKINTLYQFVKEMRSHVLKRLKRIRKEREALKV